MKEYRDYVYLKEMSQEDYEFCVRYYIQSLMDQTEDDFGYESTKAMELETDKIQKFVNMKIKEGLKPNHFGYMIFNHEDKNIGYIIHEPKEDEIRLHGFQFFGGTGLHSSFPNTSETCKYVNDTYHKMTMRYIERDAIEKGCVNIGHKAMGFPTIYDDILKRLGVTRAGDDEWNKEVEAYKKL